MRKIFLIAIVALLGSCKTDAPKTERLKVETISSQPNNEISIITIDSCEYIKYEGYYKGSVTHKGNCKNPIHWKTITR